MASRQAPPHRQRFPLLARVWAPLVALPLAALLAALATRPLRSFDSYFHLRFGEEFRHDWSIAHPGQPSVASSNDWSPTQWLPQIGMSWVYDIAGTRGLVVLFALLVVALAATTHLLLRRHVGPGPAVVGTAIVIAGALPFLTLRPQVLSYLFLIIVIAGWDRARASGRAPWWLVPLGWLWAVSHGMWILGVGASAVLAISLCLDRRPARGEMWRLLVIPVGMLIAACLTPVGPRLVDSVFLVNSRAEHFGEWAAPELATPGNAPVTLLLAAAIVLMVRRDGVTAYDIAMLGLGTAFALYSSRTLPLALIVLVTLVARELVMVRARRAPAPGPGRAEYAAIIALGIAVVLLAQTMPVRDVPADEVTPFEQRLTALSPQTMVLTDRATGAVLLWTQPQLDIPIHGYGDVYTDAELEAYDDLARLDPGWQDTLTDLGVHVALLPADDRLAPALQDLGWTVDQESDDLVYLVAP